MARERSCLEVREHPRDEAPVPGAAPPCRGSGASRAASSRVERDRGLRLLAAPDAEARVPRLGQIDGDAQAAVADVGMTAEVLDDLRPLRLAAMRAEAEVVLHSLPRIRAAAHRARSMPLAAQVKPSGAAHRVDRRRLARPELEARGALRDEHLEPVEDARARRGRRLRRRRPRIREVDQRLPRPAARTAPRRGPASRGSRGRRRATSGGHSPRREKTRARGSACRNAAAAPPSPTIAGL